MESRHETSSRKRRYCTICQQDFSDRYFRRHTCEEKAENISQPTQSKCDEPILLPASEPEMENFENQMEESDMEEEFLMGHLSSSSSDSTSEEEVLDTELFNEFYLDNIEHRENESEKQSVDIQGGYQNYVIAVLKILLVWQVVHYVSDAAFSVLLFLLRSLFYLFSFSSDLAKSFYQSFPVTMYQLHKYISFEKDDFEKYVVCPKCHCLYEFQDCCHLVEGIQTSKLCSNVVMPNHVMSHYRRPCGELLLKSINVGGKKKLIARKTYCYKSLKLSLQRLVNRKDFEETCELWRFREVPHDVFNDVYDGEIWQKFNGLEYNFFTSERNYGVMMNVDWFQPFKYSNYSIGAIYLTILNLPREERFKKKNMILVGLIPDMKSEPPTNSFIEPLVEELREAWHGFSLKSYKSKTPVIFKLVLLCVGCDIPASRKLCGFLGHGATRGCNKCMKQFEGGIGEKSYAGFNFSEWEMRDAKSHRDIVRKIVKSKTKGKRENLEKFYGVRYSVLLELDYFDPIRMTIIDPMHNLFLGTAKRVLNLWIDYKVLSADDLKQMQARVEKVHCPSDIGKLPQKFASSFGSFNADQWKNWTVLFSIYVLKDILPVDHLDYWRKFVLACKILCTRSLTKNNVKVAHLLLLSFCEKIEKAFDGKGLTMNMHLHAHLQRCIFDFGPVYSFWLFSFERENGILGSFPTNKRCIEMQLMRKFEKSMHVFDISYNENVNDDFGPDFLKMLSLYDEKDRGSLQQMKSASKFFDYMKMSSRHTRYDVWDWTFDTDKCLSFSSTKNCTLSEKETEYLQQMYLKLYPNVPHSSMVVCMSCRSVKDVSIFGSVLGVKNGRSSRSSIVVANWCAEDGKIADFDDMELDSRPGQILKIYLHNVIINGKSSVHVIAKVQWYGKLEEGMKFYYGKPVTVWRNNIFEQEGPASFIPVQRIRCKAVFAFDIVCGERNVIVIVPRERFLS